MQFNPPLVRGALQRRYKRFLADVTLADGSMITAACANTGSMLGLCAPGSEVWLSVSDNPKRKYAHSWELVHKPQVGLLGINTGSANRIVEEALQVGAIPQLAGYDSIRREVTYGSNSRFDFLLTRSGHPPCYVEVKSVTLYRKAGLAEFPDSGTSRGSKHLAELANIAQSGQRAVMVYLIQGGTPSGFAIAADIDKTYAAAFVHARKCGVEAIALTCHVSPDRIDVAGQVPVEEPQ